MSISEFFRRIALFIPLCCCGLYSQSYQTQFSEVKYDRSRGPATQHDGVEVEVATGSISMRFPLGPGIGNEGVQFTPTLVGNWAPQAKVRRATQYLPDGGDYEATKIFQTSNGGFRIIPGYLDIPVLASNGRPVSFSLPDGQNGSAIDASVIGAPDVLTIAQAQSLIFKFGYGSGWDVAPNPGGVLTSTSTTSLVTNGPLIRKGTGGELIIGLFHASQAPMITTHSYYGKHVVPAAEGWYCAPGRILVVRGGTAYEMLNLGQSYRPAKADPFDPWNEPWNLTEVNFHLGRILNRFGDSVEFSVSTGGTYSATWKRGGVSTGVGVSIQDDSNGGLLVTYQGVPGAPSFQLSRGVLADPTGGVADNDMGITSIIRDMKILSLSNQGSGEITRFNYDSKSINWHCLEPILRNDGSSFYVDSVAQAEVISSVNYPTHTLVLSWDSYTYLRNKEGVHWAGIVPENFGLWPSYAWGVTQVEDRGEGVTRKTVYDRRVPVFNFYTHIFPQAGETPQWLNYNFDCLVTHPDLSATLTRFVRPLPWGQGGPSDSDANQMQTLAFLKHKEEEVRRYAIGVDALSDRDAEISGTSAYSITVSDRWDVRTLGNSIGSYDRHPVPYQTRTRIWDKESDLVVTDERTWWDGAEFGWKRSSHRVDAFGSGLPISLLSLARTGGTEDVSSALFREKTDFGYEFKDTEWLGPFVVSEQKMVEEDRTIGHAPDVAMPQAGPLLQRTYDAMGRLHEVKQGVVAPISTILGYKADSGTLAPKLDNAKVIGPSFGQSGSVGVDSYDYDANGFLTSIRPMVDGMTNLTVGQSQDGFGRPVGQTDQNGLTKVISWDAAGRLKTIVPPGGEKEQIFEYSTDFRTVEIARGDQWSSIGFTEFGQPTRESRRNQDGSSSHRRWYYDLGGRKTWETVWQHEVGNNTGWSGSPVGVKATHYEYDSRGRVSRVTNPLSSSNPMVVTETTYGRLRKTITTGGSSTIYISDEVGRLARIVNANGQITTYGYDGLGRIASVRQYPASYFDGTEWKETGTPQTRTWSYHPEHGWITSISQPESGITNFGGFSVVGKPQTTTYTDNLVVSTSYDGLGRVTKVVSNDGTVDQAFVFDGNAGGGRPAGGFGLAKGKISYARDKGVEQWHYYRPESGGFNGRLESLDTRIWSSGQVGVGTQQGFLQRFRYDNYGNRTHAFNGNSWTVNTFNSHTGLPTKVDRALADASAGQPGAPSPIVTAAYGFDDWNLGNLTWSGGVSSFFGFDSDQTRLRTLLHQFKKTDGTPDSQTWTYSYDDQGRLESDGEDTYSYDALGRLWSATIKRATDSNYVSQTFDYDAFGNLVHMKSSGALPSSQIPGANLTSFTMSEAQRLGMALTNRLPNQVCIENSATPRIALPGTELNTGVTYDGRGNLTGVYRYPNDPSTQVVLSYDGLGRVMRMVDSNRAITEFYSYTPAGLRVRTETRSGTTLQKVAYSVYDDDRRLVAQYQDIGGTGTQSTRMAILAGDLSPTANIESPAGPITVLTGQVVNFSGWGTGSSFRWTFGDGASASGTSVTHAYSSVGVYTVKFIASRSGYPNAIASVQVTVTAGTPPLAIQSFSASQAPVNSGTSVTLSWAVTSATSLSLSEIGTVTGNSHIVIPYVSTTYVLTAMGVSGQTVSATLTVRVNPPGTAAWQRDVFYLGSKEIAEVDSIETRVTLSDHLGTPRLLLNSDGQLISRQKFLPFGQTLDVAGTSLAKGFTNHEQTDPSGLIYMQARFYAPWYGRFLSPDPARDQHFEETQSWNIYSYVQNNPTMHFDPNGEADIFVFRPAASKTSAGWKSVARTAERNGNTVHFYNGAAATVENYKAALATPDGHVVVSGHSVVDRNNNAASVNLANGDVGTIPSEAHYQAGVRETPVGEVQASTVGVFGCNTSELAPQYSSTTFTGVEGGTDHGTTLTTLDAAARAYTNVLAKDGTTTSATSAANAKVKASTMAEDHNGDRVVTVEKKKPEEQKKEN